MGKRLANKPLFCYNQAMHIVHPLVKKLLVYYKEIALLIKIKAILEWDLNVNLPSKASQGRSLQVEYLAKQLTLAWKKKEFLYALEKAQESQDELSEKEKSIVRNLVHSNKYYQNVPSEIIAEKEKVTSQAFMVWQKARAENAFKDFLPFLKEIIRLNQIIANHLGFEKNPYDALLDLYEPGLTAKKTADLFGSVKPALIALVKDIQNTKNYLSESSLIEGKHMYPESEQKRLSLFMMRRLGFDFEAGRLDVSAHPFTTTLDRYDVRLTTRYKKKDFRDSYSSSTHESGHAIYEQDVSPDFDSTPLEGGASFGIHEAMSRFWENMVAKNPAFLHFMFPVFQRFYPLQLGNISEEEFIRLMNIVKPSFIRIEADEVTYSLHIILRFEMENALINGKITPKDAAEVWAEKSNELFGIRPKTDAEGLLQDVHWSYGAFGYFPSYALGNLYGAHLLHYMKKDIPFEKYLEKGELGNIHSWLKEKIHTHGTMYLPSDLIKNATGESLNPQYFISYLSQKYKKIYR